jgi:aminoglycoside 6'-N-acetyltransferase
VRKPFVAETLAGEHVRLVPATAGQIPAIASVLADPTVARWWTAPDPEAEARRIVATQDDDVVAWVIEFDGAVVGILQAWEETDPGYRHAGVDLSLAADAQGRGLGPDAMRAVIRWLFEVRGHHRITVDPSAANDHAIRAYAKVGFRPVGVMRAYERGVDGTWHDGLLMDLLRREFLCG